MSEPQRFTPLTITPDIEQAPWNDLPAGTELGMIERVGLLRHGTTGGKAVVMIAIRLPDGSVAAGQTTWALWRTANRGLAATPIVAEEVIDP